MLPPTTNAERMIETSVCGRGGDVIEKEVSNREIHEEREGMYAKLGNNRDGFRNHDNAEGRELRAKIGAKVAACDDEAGKKNVFAMTDETGLTGR